MNRFRLGIRFYLFAGMVAVMSAGVAVIALATQELAQKFYLIEKEDETGFMVSLLSRELAQDGASGMASDDKKAETARKIIRQHFDPVFMRGITILNFAYRLLDSSYQDAAELYDLVHGAKKFAAYSAPKAAFLREQKPPVVRVVAPWRDVNNVSGYVVIDYKLGDMAKLLLFSRGIIFAYALFYMLVSVITGLFIADAYIIKPLKGLLAATTKVTGGDFDVERELNIKTKGEMAGLLSNFRVMIDSLEAKEIELNNRIQELERVNKALEQAQTNLMRSEKMASLGSLAAGLSHEIGNPLASIQGYAEIIESEKTPEAVAQFAPEIRKELDRINRIIRGLLAYGRPGSGEKSLVNMAELISEVMRMVSPQRTFKDISFNADFSGRASWNVKAVREGLEQALVNLFLNASQAMDGKGEIKIKLQSLGEANNILKNKYAYKLDPTKDYIILSIEDSGKGIPEENLTKIFDPFFTTKPVGQGTGLGLALTHKIIEENEGIIDVESAAGIGAIFFIILPLAQPRA